MNVLKATQAIATLSPDYLLFLGNTIKSADNIVNLLSQHGAKPGGIGFSTIYGANRYPVLGVRQGFTDDAIAEYWTNSIIDSQNEEREIAHFFTGDSPRESNNLVVATYSLNKGTYVTSLIAGLSERKLVSPMTVSVYSENVKSSTNHWETRSPGILPFGVVEQMHQSAHLKPDLEKALTE